MLNNIFTIIICILFLTLKCFSQRDAIVDKVEYNHIKYYDNKRINELGNYKSKGKSKVKNGSWFFFDLNSNIVAKGDYRKNKKSGPWIEIESDNDL